MKKLDEVIKALRCTDPEVDPETKCNDCPYKESHRNELWHVGPSCLDEMFADALRYLKEYKNTDENYKKAIAHVTEVIAHYEKMVADYLAVNNPPIDYYEMKIREPYWIEQDNGGYIYGGWEIPEDNRTDDYGEYLLMQSGKKLRRFDASWQAYRKERE